MYNTHTHTHTHACTCMNFIMSNHDQNTSCGISHNKSTLYGSYSNIIQASPTISTAHILKSKRIHVHSSSQVNITKMVNAIFTRKSYSGMSVTCHINHRTPDNTNPLAALNEKVI